MGGLQECAIRGLIYIGLARGRVDERGLNALKLIRLSDGMPRLYAEFKAMARDQFFMLLLDTEATLEAIPVLSFCRRDADRRQEAFDSIKKVSESSGGLKGDARERLNTVRDLFGLGGAGGKARLRGESFKLVPKLKASGDEQSPLRIQYSKEGGPGMSSDFIEKRASHEKYAQLMARAAEVTSPKTIVVYPCDATSLRGAVEAAEAELIAPVLVGPAEKIRAVAQKFGLDISRFEIVQAGPDAFVFTAGTGENLAPLRGRVASKLAWLGVKLDETANAGRMISTPDSAVAVYVIPTNDRSTYAVRVP